MNPMSSLVLDKATTITTTFPHSWVLLVYGYLVYFIAAALTFTFLYLLSCKAISQTRIVALVLFPR